ncbi:hypothetical protein LXG23DRAFT_47374 [Yarrowia lipolytica]|uniref:Uncharacterized protein n=1 Tax=Yarrowia lipolytica TaxID=4952 RepID=A0A1D8NPQ9_YARLL|nr:hypothetical protein YALI1_F30593g [Yarrowia lipolytica]KAB8280477.1 hypothetical protein BKA91DRAFT_141844 [Yarrowia lipolytica]KAE8169588.1 hypothetical protein BKA90DRAFT_142335 [Yarrowia lipolytica]KAJ8055332.1 hypothetical protein LXG23DRAFT_47374 [Yarrowia lipolytica]RMJ00118.1 hypothetical protein BD777DRAFT_122800 [Yarrowia lipolytica]
MSMTMTYSQSVSGGTPYIVNKQYIGAIGICHATGGSTNTYVNNLLHRCNYMPGKETNGFKINYDNDTSLYVFHGSAVNLASYCEHMVVLCEGDMSTKVLALAKLFVFFKVESITWVCEPSDLENVRRVVNEHLEGKTKLQSHFSYPTEYVGPLFKISGGEQTKKNLRKRLMPSFGQDPRFDIISVKPGNLIFGRVSQGSIKAGDKIFMGRHGPPVCFHVESITGGKQTLIANEFAELQVNCPVTLKAGDLIEPFKAPLRDIPYMEWGHTKQRFDTIYMHRGAATVPLLVDQMNRQVTFQNDKQALLMSALGRYCLSLDKEGLVGVTRMSAGAGYSEHD